MVSSRMYGLPSAPSYRMKQDGEQEFTGVNVSRPSILAAFPSGACLWVVRMTSDRILSMLGSMLYKGCPMHTSISGEIPN